MKLQVKIDRIEDMAITLSWTSFEHAESYHVYWSDRDTEKMVYKLVADTKENVFVYKRSTHIPHYFKVAAVVNGEETAMSDVIASVKKRKLNPQREKLNRGLVVVKTNTGIFLSWRLLSEEVTGYSETGVTGADFKVYRNGECIATVSDSTNYLDTDGKETDIYQVVAMMDSVKTVMTDAAKMSATNGEDGRETVICEPVSAWKSGENYVDIPLQIPEGGVTPAGEVYTYNANDLSIADVDGDGEYEYILKWDPTNSHDVSHKGYTGHCYIDCYKLSGRLLWRLDMGVNIRAGAHYTQFMVYDFDGDGKAEMAVKTAPGTHMTIYAEDGCVEKEFYVTLPEEDAQKGVTHEDNYVCSAKDYYEYMVERFRNWREHPEVKNGNWPDTLEECFGIEKRYQYPLNREAAEALVEYFIKEFATSKSPKNELDKFEGFIFKGPEYLTMFVGDGRELETIPFKYGRVDDGLLWGDYAMKRIEPCNRVDRFLSGVAYLDGERPYLITCRGYYTRTTIVAYDFFEGHFREKFSIDSGFVPMKNPFNDNPHLKQGTDPVYGILAGQGDHSLSTADVDGDGCQEIIYGAATIDHDGSVLYSSYGKLPDGRTAKFGHGDSMHVAKINPDKPGLEIFNVFEEGKEAPYGYALRDAETGEAIFGEYAECDLGRCMIGDINPNVRGLQVWANEIVYSCMGEVLEDVCLSTNQCIHWAADLSTQVLDGANHMQGKHAGVINDNTHGVMLAPEGIATNNGTKGNACLVADIFGDFREELVLRKADNSAIRIYTNTELTGHKLFTLMHDIQYRTGIAWQNNCYNQPCYTSFYYASDMEWKTVWESV